MNVIFDGHCVFTARLDLSLSVIIYGALSFVGIETPYPFVHFWNNKALRWFTMVGGPFYLETSGLKLRRRSFEVHCTSKCFLLASLVKVLITCFLGWYMF